jgi:hypothetical protein
MNGALRNLRNLINKDKLPESTKEKLIRRYGSGYKQLIEDIKNQNISNMDVLDLANSINKATQPISLAEVPLNYQTKKGMRFLWTLWTYRLKKLDMFYDKFAEEIKAGRIDKATFRTVCYLLTYLCSKMFSALFWEGVMAFARGRRWCALEMAINGALESVTLSRFHVHQFRRHGFWGGLRRYLTPAGVMVIENLFRDIRDIAEYGASPETLRDLYSTQNIPIVGRPYFFWYGQGHEWVMDDIMRHGERTNRGRFYQPTKQPQLRLQKWIDEQKH